MIGDQFVDISSGNSRHFVSPGGEIALKSSPDLLKTLDIGQFKERLKVVSALLDDIEQGRSDLGQFIQGDQMYSDLRKRFSQIESGIRAAASTTSNVGRELHTDQLYQQISRPLIELDGSLARLQSGQGDAGQLLRDSAATTSCGAIWRTCGARSRIFARPRSCGRTVCTPIGTAGCCR